MAELHAPEENEKVQSRADARQTDLKPTCARSQRRTKAREGDIGNGLTLRAVQIDTGRFRCPNSINKAMTVIATYTDSSLEHSRTSGSMPLRKSVQLIAAVQDDGKPPGLAIIIDIKEKQDGTCP
jgi:hypothetical protein